jgi:hypothetical protein
MGEPQEWEGTRGEKGCEALSSNSSTLPPKKEEKKIKENKEEREVLFLVT